MPCEDAKAEYQVIDMEYDREQPLAGDIGPCAKYANATAAYWDGDPTSGDGTLWCLADNR